MPPATPLRSTGRAALPAVVGLGWRPELAADLLAAPASIGCAEVVAETCFTQPAARREASALAEIWPVVLHGVKLSLGAAEGIDLDRARRLGALARELRSPVVSEHVALTRAGGRDIGHLTAVPFTRAAVKAVADNVARARRVLPDVPLLLENIAWTLRFDEDEMDEGTFHAEVAQATGCDLLLDLANLYANALNAGTSPEALLQRYPLDRVGMVHIAGGAHDGGFYVDTHADAVPDAVFALLESLVRRAGPLPVILERDDRFPAFAAIEAELARARTIVDQAPPTRGAFSHERRTFAAVEDGLAERQARLAIVLTSDTREHDGAFAEDAIARSRTILRHKRVDDAVPLLRHCAPCGDTLRPLAFRTLQDAPRVDEALGIADARRIADAACDDTLLAERARRDRLELRARFDGGNRARLLPFAGFEDLPGGRRIWAFKGFGRDAPLRVVERSRA